MLQADEITGIGAATRRLVDCYVRRERVPPGETTRILCTHEIAVGDPSADNSIYELAVPYGDFPGGQTVVAVARLRHMHGNHWSLHDVKQVDAQALRPELRPSGRACSTKRPLPSDGPPLGAGTAPSSARETGEETGARVRGSSYP